MRLVSDPASQNAAPLDDVVKPPMVLVTRETSPVDASLRDAQELAFPAPAAMRPALGMYLAPICCACFICGRDMRGLPCSSRAPAPLTIGVDMLLPLSL